MNCHPVHRVPGWARKTGTGATVEVRGEPSPVEMSSADPFCLACNNLTPILGEKKKKKKSNIFFLLRKKKN